MCSVGLEKCDSDQPCPLHDAWSTVRDGMKSLLEDTTLEQMANTLQQKLDLIR
jgi:DNA-binding IscR family transcriptional regulator